ncbi:MAG: alpha/beta fold hydrolase [Candidatus Lokiarchaeota archaeon]|nr:alpha/beta fold hydrolase [Candidatus Lokiarchaeota archaeon]
MDDSDGKIAVVNHIEYWYQFVNTEEEDSPLIVLLHGFSGNRTRLQILWDHYQKKGYPILRIDLKGHGQSQKENVKEYNLETCAEEIIQLIDDIAINATEIDKAVIIGHSMGGMIAQWIGIKNPEFLKALILVSTVPYLSEKFEKLTAFASKFYPLIMRFLFKNQKKQHKELGLEYFPEWLPDQSHLQPDTQALREYLISMNEFNVEDKLDRIKVPTLILGGEEDNFGTPKLLKIMNSKIPNSHLEIFPKSGHYPYIDHPDEFIKKINNFLD